MSEPSEPGRLLREQIDARLREAAPMPDPADVFDRAHRLDDDALDRLDDEHVLAPFIEAYVERLDHELMGSEPGAAPLPYGRGRGGWVMVLAAAAALVLVAGALSWLVGERRAASESTDDAGQEAQHELRDSRRTAEASFPSPEAPRAKGSRSERTPVEAPAGEVVPENAEVPLDEPETEHSEVPAVPPKPSLDERLAELDAKAQAAWRRGDLRTAERRYRSIVKLGGRREVAELAYGELFAIVRQRGGSLPSLWRAYLRRFPRGRYAEDVEAGLCRRAAAGEREGCWERYRRRYPDGIHGP